MDWVWMKCDQDTIFTARNRSYNRTGLHTGNES